MTATGVFLNPPYTLEQRHFACAVMQSTMERLEGPALRPHVKEIIYEEALKAIIEYDKFRAEQIEHLKQQVIDLVGLIPGPINLPGPRSAK